MTADHGEDPQLKLLLLSQRLTSLKRQREYNLTDIIGDTESSNDMDADKGYEFSEEENEGDDDNDFRSKSFESVDEKGVAAGSKNSKVFSEGEEDDDEIDPISRYRHGSRDSFTKGYVDIDEDFGAQGPVDRDLHLQEGEGEHEDDADVLDFKPQTVSKLKVSEQPEAECSKTGLGFSRLADYYRNPEFLHDVRQINDVVDVDNHKDDDYSKGNVVDNDDEAMIKREASSDERKRLPRKKSASNAKSARRSRPGMKQKLRQTLSGRLLEVSDDIAPSSNTAIKMDALFHQCVCAYPWRCLYSSHVRKHSSADVYLNEGDKKSLRHGGEDRLIGWFSSKNERYGYGGSGRKVLSARDSNRRKKYDPFIHRNINDSAKYTFKHYQDWQAYVDEYRRYYTLNQTGMAMKSHQIPEGGGRREAVVIVRTLSESLIRPRLQEYNLPDWDDFTDLGATSMRPLHLGPGYRSGKVPDLGVTWLAAATAHHHEVPVDYRHPASRHIKLTNIRHPESMATQIKKRNQKALLDSSLSTQRVGPIMPHDAGVKIPMEPLHIVEDFRKGPRKDRHGVDMQPIGCRFLASWRPSDSTHVKSAKTRSRKSKIDGGSSESIPKDDSPTPRSQMYSKQGSLQPLTNGENQSRAGLLKLFSPPKELDVPSQTIDTATKVKGKMQSAAKSVDASKWTNLPSSAEKSSTEKAGSSKSRANLQDKSGTEKRSATKSGTLARKPPTRQHTETQSPQTEFLHVRGESKKDKSQEIEPQDGEILQSSSSSSSTKEKESGVFAKTRIKLVAPYAQPLAQDNVLIGSPYMTSPHFGNEELSPTLQLTG